MIAFAESQADFERRPLAFLELASVWAAGGTPPDARHAEWAQIAPRPLFPTPAAAREAFWKLLSQPERGRALVWLDRTGLLQELLPVWAGDPARRSRRLRAVEEVHRERWAADIGALQFDWLCVYMDQQADGRLGGWALTGLAALLLTGDADVAAHAALVERDLRALDANSGERERIVTAVREYPALRDAMLKDAISLPRFAPTTIVAALASCFAEADAGADLLARAVRCGDKALSRYAAGADPS